MTKPALFAALFCVIVSSARVATAQTFVSGSTGADGPFNPDCAPKPCTVTVDLPQNGVFNFTTVTVPSGVEVRFKPNALNTPVFLLATGNVTINGSINIDGGLSTTAYPSAAGPGGYQGGHGGFLAGSSDGRGPGPGGGRGLGPGGGGGGPPDRYGAGAGFATPGETDGWPCDPCAAARGATYGNEFLVPLIGGSGGGGGGAPSGIPGTGGAGGSGGGALLVASTSSIALLGAITARGGNRTQGLPPGPGQLFGGGASGGAIRLVANVITGNPQSLDVSGGGDGPYGPGCGCSGGMGRIRLEFFSQQFIRFVPSATSVGSPGSVFVPGLPSLRIASVGGTAVPPTPRGSYASPDLSLPPTATNPVRVALAASNIPLGTTVDVMVVPQFGAPTTVTSTPLGGALADSTATADVTLPIGGGTPVVLMAQLSFSTQTAELFVPPINGERVAAVRVNAALAGGSTLTYITESGREVSLADGGPLVQRRLENSGVK